MDCQFRGNLIVEYAILMANLNGGVISGAEEFER